MSAGDLHGSLTCVVLQVERYELQCNPTGDPQQNIYKLMDSVNPATGKVRWAPFEQVDLDLDALFGRMRS